MTAPLPNLIPDIGDRAATLGEIAAMRARLDALERQVAGTMALPGAALFPRVWVDRLADLVAMEWGISTDDLRGACRRAVHVRPRFVWVWLVWRIGKFTHSQCAALCGYLDHTMSMHACRRVDGWRADNPDFRAVTDQLLQIGGALRAPLPAAVEGDQ
ncbi:MAG: hypothetical protein KGQ52_14480 [Alphaproteobacteria bacterium]|nr:hypothetical protein [Alphaproteobacteria bacterium]